MEVFIGFITPFPWNWAPYQWSLCNGGVLPVSQNAALYSLLGNIYGGNQVNFNLPDLRGRQIVGMGQRPGGSDFTIGDYDGAESVTLSSAQVPLAAHTHPATFTPGAGGALSLSVSTAAPTTATPLLTNGQTAYLANSAAGGAGNALKGLYTTTAPAADAAASIPVNSGTGGGTVTVNANNPTAAAAVSLMNPYLALNFCIALYGIYPSHN